MLPTLGSDFASGRRSLALIQLDTGPTARHRVVRFVRNDQVRAELSYVSHRHRLDVLNWYSIATLYCCVNCGRRSGPMRDPDKTGSRRFAAR